jgi:hypothetical protein
MTQRMKERKIKYIEKTMEYLDIEFISVSDKNSVSEIMNEIGLPMPEDGHRLSFRYYLYCSPGQQEMILRDGGFERGSYPATNTMIDEVFFHCCQILPQKIYQDILENEYKNKIHNLILKFEDIEERLRIF